jgi:hypothetical protein
MWRVVWITFSVLFALLLPIVLLALEGRLENMSISEIVPNEYYSELASRSIGSRMR